MKVSISTWHQRLGHPVDQLVQQVISRSQLPLSSSDNKVGVCESCQVSKSRQLTFRESSRVSTHPLELVHSDVWSSPILSSNGYKYYVFFVDDFSRFSWLFPIKFKSDVFSCFMKFKCYAENLLSTKIKFFQSDGGGEYTSNQFKDFLQKNGIGHRISCPHTP